MQKEKIQGFGKDERLYRKKEIKELFDKGSSFYLYPFRVRVMDDPDSDHHRVLFSVSRRNFKKAVDRNLIKRRMREAYRRNKFMLSGLEARRIAFIYTQRAILPYDQLESAMLRVFKKLSD